MKKLLLILVCALGYLVQAQDRSLGFGLLWGLHGNHSDFAGGMEEANARFHHNPYEAGSFELTARYDHDKHWMAMTGFGLNTFGFDFALSENYSLINEQNRFSTINTTFTNFQMPVMIYYKFNPDCKNRKWLIGAGFVSTATGKQSAEKNFEEGTEGNNNLNYLNSKASADDGFNCMLRLSVGREKILKCGSILHVSLTMNLGPKEIARASVLYTVDGKEYNHDFTNSGNFVGLRFGFFCNHLCKKLPQ